MSEAAALDNPAPVDTGNPGSSEGGTDNGGTILDNDISGNAPPQTWHDNWRIDMAVGVAGEDEIERGKMTNILDRFNSPVDLAKSYRELHKQQSQAKNTPVTLEKPNANSEESYVKAYREQNGIPETSEGYELNYDDGTVIGEETKEAMKGFFDFAHENHYPQDQVKDVVKWYMQDMEREEQRVAEMNEQAKIKGSAELMSEWGGEYQGNLNAMHSLFVNAPEGVKEDIMGAIGEDGLKLGNKPNTIKWLVGLAKELNPQATLIAPGEDATASIDSQIAEIQGWMNSKDPVEKDKYWKDPKVQQRLLDLTKAKQSNR